jgi:hypothetical protein
MSEQSERRECFESTTTSREVTKRDEVKAHSDTGGEASESDSSSAPSPPQGCVHQIRRRRTLDPVGYEGLLVCCIFDMVVRKSLRCSQQGLD